MLLGFPEADRFSLVNTDPYETVTLKKTGGGAFLSDTQIQSDHRLGPPTMGTHFGKNRSGHFDSAIRLQLRFLATIAVLLTRFPMESSINFRREATKPP